MNALDVSDFYVRNYDYELPSHLIASKPTSPRENGKLLVYNRLDKSITHAFFRDFCDIVPNDYTLICNDTKVIKARIYAYKDSTMQGKKLEIFFHKPFGSLSDTQTPTFLVQIRGKLKQGACLFVESSTQDLTHYDAVVRVESLLENGMRLVSFWCDSDMKTSLSTNQVLDLFESIGHIPLPPYIKRADTLSDMSDYQSVFARHIGAVAAPTASLHFEDKDFEKLKKHYEIAYLTLHIGAGTFGSVNCEDIRDFVIHTESFSVSPLTQEIVCDNAKKIFCIGSTSARVVEHFYRTKKSNGECDIFLHPKNPPMRVNGILTNFHLPKSTLLMMISGFVGREECLRIYECAKQQGYKFYSYGDGMVII